MVSVVPPASVSAITPVEMSAWLRMLRNILHNAEVHGGKGDIHIRVSAHLGDICISIINEAGSNHGRCLEMQDEHGVNYLLKKHATLNAGVEKIGTTHSTYLGMREISMAADVVAVDPVMVFRDDIVETTLCFRAIEVPVSV